MRYHLAKRKAGCYNVTVKIFLPHCKDGRLDVGCWWDGADKMLPEGGFSKESQLAKANHHNRGRRGTIMRFAALGERKNPAVLFFHAMGVNGRKQ